MSTVRSRTLPFTPGKVLGIGLNYRAHAADLGEESPRRSPVSFFKAAHTWVGEGEPIVVPAGIGRVTAEAELGLVIGRPCRRVGVEQALSYVAGICAVLDQTAEEVLLENPRYLSRTKNYPTFFSFGPSIVPFDQALDRVGGSLADLEVATIVNGQVHCSNIVAGMVFSPEELISHLSHVMPLDPGDIISTGTPGAVPIAPGDEVACRLTGVMTLTNPVVAE
jgi:2-keto-4-pentenoate hydratase/2-oxohepta-3-ene-1,7-dioic acid hydratase in catechol pathway